MLVELPGNPGSGVEFFDILLLHTIHGFESSEWIFGKITHRIQIEQSRNLLQPQKLVSYITKRRL